MKEVFLLGAGFSKAASRSMPLLSEISEQIMERPGIPDEVKALGDNVEHWLSYLSQPQPWNLESENLSNKSRFLEITRAIGEIIRKKEDQRDNNCPEWMKHLVAYWHEHQCAVITLNYDTLIERAILSSWGLGVWPDNTYPIILPNIRRNGTTEPELYPGLETLTLCKLHGSINWFYSGADSYYGETIYSAPVISWSIVEHREELEGLRAAKDKVPLIAPPTTEKVAYFQHESMRRVWNFAAEALRAADHLVCIGYSLPVTDMSMQFLLKSSRRHGEIPLTIVDRSESVHDHYSSILANSYRIHQRYHGDHAVEDLVDAMSKSTN